MVVESRSAKRNAKNALGLGRDRAAEPGSLSHFSRRHRPLSKSCTSYFRFARFNTLPLYYLRAWHRLLRQWREERTREQKKQRGTEDEVGANSTERGFVRKNGQRRSFALSRPTFILHDVVSLTHSLFIVTSP